MRALRWLEDNWLGLVVALAITSWVVHCNVQMWTAP